MVHLKVNATQTQEVSLVLTGTNEAYVRHTTVVAVVLAA